MEINSRALIISYIKYGETSAIVRFFSRDTGFITLMWKGVFTAKNKSKSLLSPLNEVQIQFRDKGNDTLTYLKKIENINQPLLFELTVEKSTLLLFLSEVLQSILQNEPEHQELYDFVIAEIESFKKSDTTQLWMQTFLLEMCNYIGSKPHANYEPESYFDLQSGNFNTMAYNHSLNKSDSALWSSFLNGDKENFTSEERMKILNFLLKYFSHQIPNFRQPKSLEVIKEIFTN